MLLRAPLQLDSELVFSNCVATPLGMECPMAHAVHGRGAGKEMGSRLPDRVVVTLDSAGTSG